MRSELTSGIRVIPPRKSVSACISAAPAASISANHLTATAATRTTRTSGFWTRKLRRLSSASLTSASTAKARSRFRGFLNKTRSGSYDQSAVCQPQGKAAAQEPVWMEGSIHRWYSGTAGIHRLYLQLQDLFQVLQAKKADSQQSGGYGHRTGYAGSHRFSGTMGQSTGAAQKQAPPRKSGTAGTVLRFAVLRRLRRQAPFCHLQEL